MYGKSSSSKAQMKSKEAGRSSRMAADAMGKLKSHPTAVQVSGRNIHHDISNLYPHMGSYGTGGRKRRPQPLGVKIVIKGV